MGHLTAMAERFASFRSEKIGDSTVLVKTPAAVAASTKEFLDVNKGQKQMVDDGLPACLIMTSDERRAARKNHIETKTETAPRLAKPETEAMKKIATTAAKAKKMASKKAIHIPKKPKKALVAKTKNKKAKEAQVAKSENKKPGRKDQVIGMMKVAGGTTVEKICAATGLLAHSARALISGIAKVEKVSTSKEAGEKTVYKID